MPPPDKHAPKIKWTIVVNADTDFALRRHLAARGTRKGDISRFVEDAVRRRLLDMLKSGQLGKEG